MHGHGCVSFRRFFANFQRAEVRGQIAEKKTRVAEGRGERSDCRGEGEYESSVPRSQFLVVAGRGRARVEGELEPRRTRRSRRDSEERWGTRTNCPVLEPLNWWFAPFDYG